MSAEVKSSRDLLNEWREELPYDLAEHIQKQPDCQKVMNLLGYELATEPDFTDEQISLMTPHSEMYRKWIFDFMLTPFF